MVVEFRFEVVSPQLLKRLAELFVSVSVSAVLSKAAYLLLVKVLASLGFEVVEKHTHALCVWKLALKLDLLRIFLGATFSFTVSEVTQAPF